MVVREVVQPSGSTNLLEADQANRSTYRFDYITCFVLFLGFFVLAGHQLVLDGYDQLLSIMHCPRTKQCTAVD